MMRAPETNDTRGDVTGEALPIDAHAWLERHSQLTFRFVSDIARAVAAPDEAARAAAAPGADYFGLIQQSEAARAAANRAHAELLRHAALVLGDHAPFVLAKNSDQAIGYEQLALARARLRATQEENRQLRQRMGQLQALATTDKDAQP